MTQSLSTIKPHSLLLTLTDELEELLLQAKRPEIRKQAKQKALELLSIQDAIAQSDPAPKLKVAFAPSSFETPTPEDLELPPDEVPGSTQKVHLKLEEFCKLSEIPWVSPIFLYRYQRGIYLRLSEVLRAIVSSVDPDQNVQSKYVMLHTLAKEEGIFTHLSLEMMPLYYSTPILALEQAYELIELIIPLYAGRYSEICFVLKGAIAESYAKYMRLAS